MAKLRIEGGRRLSGRIVVEGNKNSALPLLAACLLTDQECVLSNVPRIRDVDVLLELMAGLGATIDRAGPGTIRVRCQKIVSDRPDPILVGKLRGSVLLLGPLLARRGSAWLAQPGGDFPARRTISTHLQALAQMGAVQLDEPGHVLKAPNGLSGASFYLDEASVTGTETALLGRQVRKDAPRSVIPPWSRTSWSSAGSCGRWVCPSRGKEPRRSVSRGPHGSGLRSIV